MLRFSRVKATSAMQADMLHILLALSFLAAPLTAALAQPEDAEHRADRLRTIELNRRAQDVVRRRDHSNSDIRETNRRAMERYERQRAAWREQVEACRAGNWSACER
jgi:Ni/Co efflux regulator RcnB